MSGNSTLFVAPLNGSLAYTDRAGGGTLTSSGAMRYAPASGARWNYIVNPSAETNASSAGAAGAGTLTRVTTEGLFGSCCFEVTGSANFDGGFWSSHTRSLIPGNTYTLSFYVKLVSGATDWKFYLNYANAAGTTAGNTSVTNFTPTASWTRYTLTFTVPTGQAIHNGGLIVVKAGAGAGTVRVDGVMITDGSAAGDYMDGSTGGVWLDPITGILGTAHASPSVSLAVGWIEEATTNLLANPSLETGAAGWGIVGAGVITNSRIQTYAIFGSYALQTVCDGSNSGQGACWENPANMASATNGTTYTASVWVRAVAGSPAVQLKVVEYGAGGTWLAETASGAVTLNDTWQRISVTRTFNQASVQYVGLRLQTNSAQAVTFATDGAQIEAKAYATSYCDGSLGTGYSWASTAHASTSTRTATSVRVAESASLVMPAAAGSAFARFARSLDNGSSTEIVNFGDYNTANKDCLQLYVASDDTLTSSWRYGTVSQVTPTVAGALAVGTWYLAGVTWSGANMDLWRDTTQATTITNRLYYGDTDSSTNYIGIGCTPAGAAPLGGYLGPVLIADRPLTARERAILNSRTAWHHQLLRPERTSSNERKGTYRRR